jgi:glycosyltransferase involved in cell wall biosynthesis
MSLTMSSSSREQSAAPGRTPEWRPKVTALVPCYNSAAFISRTLDCLAAQTWPNLEILIGDDCSSDATLEVVRDFAKGRENVRLLARDTNLGWLRNSNDLMAHATGELMFFAFHDDLIAPSYVAKLVDALRDRPAAIMAFSDLELVEVDGSRSVCIYDEMTGLDSSLARGFVMAKFQGGWWVPNRGLFRATAFERIGGIKPNDSGEYCADWTWLLHMSLLGEFVRVPEVLCQKFFMKGSLSKTWPHDSKQRAALRRAGIREIRGSSLGLLQKAFLMACVKHSSPFPRRVNRLLKRAIGLPA